MHQELINVDSSVRTFVDANDTQFWKTCRHHVHVFIASCPLHVLNSLLSIHLKKEKQKILIRHWSNSYRAFQLVMKMLSWIIISEKLLLMNLLLTRMPQCISARSWHTIQIENLQLMYSNTCIRQHYGVIEFFTVLLSILTYMWLLLKTFCLEFLLSLADHHLSFSLFVKLLTNETNETMMASF